MNQVSEVNDTAALFQVIRTFRVLRVLRIIKGLRKLRGLIRTFIRSLPSIVNITIVLFLILLVFSIFFVQFFATVALGDSLTVHANFRHFTISFYTLFRGATGENWNGIMYDIGSQRTGCVDTDDVVYNFMINHKNNTYMH